MKLKKMTKSTFSIILTSKTMTGANTDGRIPRFNLKELILQPFRNSKKETPKRQTGPRSLQFLITLLPRCPQLVLEITALVAMMREFFVPSFCCLV